MSKVKVAVHKFSSCDGCQLAFLNAGADLLLLSELVDIKHFVEAGPVDEDAEVDIAFIEGSISTRKEQQRIEKIRQQSNYLVTIGACATSGGIQALRNFADGQKWLSSIYASPEYIDSLDTVSPISEYVHVDFEIWGCPVTSKQVLTVIRSLLSGVTPRDTTEKVCMECKRNNTVCTLVTKSEPCLGAVTKAGCGALCPAFGRDCFSCFGPAQDTNTSSLANRLAGFGLSSEEVCRRYQLMNNNAPVFRNICVRVMGQHND